MRGVPLPLPEIGAKFGQWTVLAIAHSGSGGRRIHCQCTCGVTQHVTLSNLRSGQSTRCRTCGDQNHRGVHPAKHGALRGNVPTPEYRSWKGMRERCTKERHPSYPHYGARGIRVCAEWLGPGGFERFLAHVGLRPSPTHSIDRYPNTNGNYEPGNVRWATVQEQNRNKGGTRRITIGDRTMCLSEWTRELGLKFETIHGRLRRGWSVARSLELPSGVGAIEYRLAGAL